VIFGRSEIIDDHYGQRVALSILTRPDPPKKSPKLRCGDAMLGKHRVWLPSVAYLIAAVFFSPVF
jgi:hypothetical protein